MPPLATPPTLVDFLTECAFDLQAGRLQPLGHYLRRHPGHPEAIAREYLAMVDHANAPAAPVERIGRYQVLREIARGGQGRVHLARDPGLGRFVAIKVLDLTGAADSSRRERFRREIDAILRLDHPHVCRLFEADVEHEPPFAAMELVGGHTLAELLALGDASAAASGGLIGPTSRRHFERFARYFEQVALAVHAVHCAGIVHRDLKPANVMVTPDGEPRVLDFGLASPAERIGELTLTDALLGTLPYMAPEQLVAGAKVDARVDVFALGVTMLQCATHEVGFEGRSPAARLASIEGGVPWRLLRRLPGDLRAILTRALSADPRGRYATCLALAEDLHRWRDHRPVTARRYGRLQVAARWCVRHPWLTAWVASTALAVGATWRAASAEQVAFAASRQLESSLVEAVRSFDPWAKQAAGEGIEALSTLQATFAAGGATVQRLAMLEIRRGRVDVAERLLAEPGVPADVRSAALRFACELLRSPADPVSAPPAIPPGGPGELVEELAAIAAELYRHSCWPALETLVEGALTAFTTPELSQARHRLPLVWWQVQATFAREQIDGMWFFDAEKRLLVDRHGADSDEVADAEERFLDLALQLAPAELLSPLRLRAKVSASQSGADPARRLRRKAFALSVASDSGPGAPDVAAIEALHAQQVTNLGPDHPDAIHTAWRLAYRHRKDPDRSRALIEQAWSGAVRLPAEREDLLANVGRDYAARADLGLDADRLEELRVDIVRRHLRLWGLGDPRTLEALAQVPLDLQKTPEAAMWRDQVFARALGDDPAMRQRDRLLFEGLQQGLASSRPLVAEQFALALQNGADALSTAFARDARSDLARLWMGGHDDLHGAAVVSGLERSVERWRAYLGSEDPGESLWFEMLSSTARVCFDRRRLVEADDLFRAAVHAAARQNGTDSPDWRLAAESLPRPDARFSVTFRATAQLAERSGRYEDAERMWRCRLPERTLAQRIDGSYFPPCPELREFAWLLVLRHDFVGAERELLRALQIHKERHDGPTETAPIRQALIDLYVVTDQPAKAAEQRMLLGR